MTQSLSALLQMNRNTVSKLTARRQVSLLLPVLAQPTHWFLVYFIVIRTLSMRSRGGANFGV